MTGYAICATKDGNSPHRIFIFVSRTGDVSRPCGSCLHVTRKPPLDAKIGSTNNCVMQRNVIAAKRSAVSRALREARRAWRIQYLDSSASIALARASLARAIATDDEHAHAWSLLTTGYHNMRYVAPADGLSLLESARQMFDKLGDRRGLIVSTVGIARCWWMQSRNREALDLLIPLRAEGLSELVEEERGMLLNGIAGCYSMLGEPAQAFAYMYQALRESSPARDHGFDVVLYCNLSHELILLGDCEEALIYANEGIERCGHLNNPRLMGVLLLNRMTCFTDLARANEALPDLHSLLTMPANVDGRGATNPSFEQMALTALRAGDVDLGATLIERAHASMTGDVRADEVLELTIAKSEVARLRGDIAGSLRILAHSQPLPAAGLGLRVRCLFFQALADAHERCGNATEALQSLRTWQALHLERSHMASQARHQAASLKTELMRLQRQRDAIDARHRSTEKARSELETAHKKLAQKMLQVQSLQASLKEQAVRDGLTDLFNRRHLGDVLPGMLALARRNNWALAVAIIDLDRFKLVNDEHGHLVGDTVLKSFAALLLAQLRKSDVVCRYGGEEFCVLMPRTTITQGRRKIDGLLKEWRAVRLYADGKVLGQQTFSAGVAESLAAGGGDESADILLKRADDCALLAKKAGRNCVLGENQELTSGQPAP